MKQSRTIGSILLDVELVTQKDIDHALELQKQSGKRLGEVLVQLGVVSDDDIRWALAEQLNLPYVNIRKDQIDADVAMLLPEKLARRYHVIPILKIEHELTVVVDDPLNTTIINDIERITKCAVKISLGRTSDILLAIDEIYGSPQERRHPEQETPPHFVSRWFNEEEIQRILNDLSGQTLMDFLLSHAFEHGVSRIYFQPGDEACHISYRMNGVLQEQIRLSQEWYSILIFRLKISADLEMTKTQQPQYREFLYQEAVSAQEAEAARPPVAMSLSILPTEAGETLVLNVIHRPVDHLWEQARSESIAELQDPELAEIHALEARLPYWKSGAIFVGGSPHSDVLRACYGLLSAYNPAQKKIVTLEASAEYRANEYYQIRYVGGKYSHLPANAAPLKTSEALDGAISLASIANPAQQQLATWLNMLRPQEMDVLFVDNIEHEVVAAQCMDAAGHAALLGMMELPTTREMLAYLLRHQANLSLLTTRVHALIAQQSVRLLCQACKQPDQSDIGKQFLAQWPAAEGEPPTLCAPVGCPECQMSGYQRHVALVEVLRMEAWLQDMICAGASVSEMERAAAAHGVRLLRDKMKSLLFAGRTSIEEAYGLLEKAA